MKGKGTLQKKEHRSAVVFLILILFATAFITAFYYFDINQKKIIQVPYISQKGSYITGCELVSTTMVLNYYKYYVTVKDVAERTPKSSLQQKDGKTYGSNPSQSFIGDPTSSSGFGCFAPVVVSVMNSFFNDKKQKTAVDVTGSNFDSLLSYIKDGDPVIVWATMNMQPSHSGKSWILRDTGKTFTWPAREHCLVLVGFDREKYYFNDPYQSNGLKSYDKSIVQKRYCELGKQAIVVRNTK